MERNNKAIKLHFKDNIATSINNLQNNDIVEVEDAQNNSNIIRVSDKIPFGHKFSLKQILNGEPVIKYGEVIGIASQDIELGKHVHIHNVEGLRGRGDLCKEKKRN